MTRHVSAERLARFREADLGRAATRRVAAHLAGCAACRAESDALARLPGLLADVSVPQLPAHLAARIENALATESAQRAATSPAPMRPAPVTPAPVTPAPSAAAGQDGGRGRQRGSGQGRQRRARVPMPARVLAAAAAVIVAGGVGFSLLQGAGGQAGGGASSGAAAPAAAPAAPRRQAPAAGQEGSRARSGPVAGPAQRYNADGSSGTFTPVRSGTDYLRGQLARQAATTLAQARTAGPRPSFVPGLSGQPSQLAGCVGRIAAGHSVLLVDVASYQGSPATVIVTGPPGASQVWVAGPACSARSSDLLAHRPLP